MANRTVIVGGPRTGKTTQAKAMGGDIVHTDTLILGRAWSEQSAAAAQQFEVAGSWTMEGCSAVRALRKWMQANPGKPCEQVVHLTQPRVPRTAKQEALARACETVFREIEPELKRRGVVIL